MSRPTLPSFRKPPVIETIMGIQFDPITGFTNAHLGLFWARIGGSKVWPHASDVPPIRPEFELFGEEQQWRPLNSFDLGITAVPTARIHLRSENRDRLLQVQNGRLIYNWLGATDREYARYEPIRKEFDHYLGEFKQFLAGERLPPIQPNQWEITYTNHLPKGTVWSDVADWQTVFKFHAVPPVLVNQCRLESFGGRWVYEITPRRGRLHMELRHAKNEAGQEVLLFNLTARGPIREGEGAVATCEAGLDLGHQVIVNSFTDLTSDSAREYWEEEAHAG